MSYATIIYSIDSWFMRCILYISRGFLRDTRIIIMVAISRFSELIVKDVVNLDWYLTISSW